MDVSLEVQRECLTEAAQEFQSLFSWMFRSKYRNLSRYLFGTGVSILVLVDVSLEGSGAVLLNCGLVSILVLVDVSLEEDYEVTE